MEQNKEMTAQESLALISETMNNSRKDILRRSGKYFLLWGSLLTFFSLLVFILWKTTGHAQWNFLWFLMPVVGYLAAHLLSKSDDADLPDNMLSRLFSGIWSAYGVFAVAVSVFTIVYVQLQSNPVGMIAAGAGMTAQLVLLFGLAETICGVALKSWPVIIGGILIGVGGLAVYYILDLGAAQMLIFTVAGVLLALTGVLIKNQR